ncbi:YtxH domain-containing protein [Niallia nealsonii]|uniref:YtxH domain-containing protein n=1 Tax=Niallia nealsonii TaxID=115979 RepID=A0A2N0Z0M1_9BACI|nr:YtxH domain-containing protein [Niallia nealsonii]PKG23043.1 hypothetical protein CWS01_13955 [Niallia nealsonii]
MSNEKHNKLMTGMVIGGLIGTAFSLLDSTTRKNVLEKFQHIKTNSEKIFYEIRENPKEAKEQISEKLHYAQAVVKDAFRDGQALYEQIQRTVVARTSDVKEITQETLDTLQHSKGEIQAITGKLKEAGTTVMPTLETNKPQNEENLPAIQGNRMVNIHPVL